MDITPQIYVTYEMVFNDEPLSLPDYLQELDKNRLVQFALYVIYSGSKQVNFIEAIQKFFCNQNDDFLNEIFLAIDKIRNRNISNPTNIIPRTYSIFTETTGLELLRQTFSIQCFNCRLSQTIQEQYLFKAILLINSNISKAKVEDEFDVNKNYTDLYYAKSLLCNFINNHERLLLLPEFISVLQIIKGYNFFRFCENTKLQPHLNQFLVNNGFRSWKQYMCNAIHLILFPLQHTRGAFPIIKLNDNLDGYDFLHAHSFDANEVIPLETNRDYTFFKSYPLIEIDKQTFFPINAIFCINHLYKSVYFEMNKINDSLDESIKIKRFSTFITTEFSEKYLFDKYIRETIGKQHGIKLSDEDCKNISSKENHRPDFYFRDGNNVFLFENKDIKITDLAINSKDYNQIGNELNKKLIDKAGVAQLVNQIVAIDNREFLWDKNMPKHPRIYPILVIDDSSLCVPGLNYILNNAFQSKLSERNVTIHTHQLVVIELDTLIAYNQYFKSGRIRIKDLIDGYYKFLQKQNLKAASPNHIMFEVYHRFLPFYTFVSHEIVGQPFDDALFNIICDELQTEKC